MSKSDKFKKSDDPKESDKMSNSISDPDQYHMDFNIGEIKTSAHQRIISLSEDNDGILFGGAVRDMIISQHYSTMYYKHLKTNNQRFKSKKFWDITNHPETAARTLVPDDLDIYFDSDIKAEKFLIALENLCNIENILMDIQNVQQTDISEIAHKYGSFLNIQNIKLTITAGKIPFFLGGFNIEIELDIVTPQYKIMMLPPFNKLDFLCNGFIKTKYGISYSSDTNTYIDKLSEIDKTIEIAKIQKDMIEFKTNFCGFEKIKPKDIESCGKNKYAFRRILKLLKKERFPWTITNLPFEMRKIEEKDVNNKTCSICLSEFELDENAIITYPCSKKDTPGNTIHKNCMIGYLKKQDEENQKFIDDSEKFTFKCPYRYKIDFTKCSCDYKA